jgi:DNA-directed RNA polymerase subunit omega
MLDDLKEDKIVNRVGGRFKLATLIQKRLIAINQGSRELVDARTRDKMQVVLNEIMNDKIYLDISGRVQTVHESLESIEGGTVDLTQGD